MKNPYKIEQQKIESLLQENKPKEVFEFIISLLKVENKDDIDLKLLSISYLNFISSEYFLPRGEDLNFRKSTGKSEELIKELKSYKSEELIKELKSYKAEELKEILLNFEASLQQSKFKFKLLNGGNYSELLEKHLQYAISNYWKSLKTCNQEEEKYNIRNNLANCLVSAGRFIEAISLFNQNIIQNPNRFQSLASWGHAMENLKEKSMLPDIPSFYFVVSERYIEAKKLAPNNHIKESIERNIERCKKKLQAMDLELSKENLIQNRNEEKEEFENFSEYRKFVLKNEISLNEHALHCHCANSEHDNLSIGLYRGSIHLNKPEKLKQLERYLNRIKSEFLFARLLFYKYEIFEESNSGFYSEDDYKNANNGLK